jgi:hypothetical protein
MIVRAIEFRNYDEAIKYELQDEYEIEQDATISDPNEISLSDDLNWASLLEFRR